MKSERMAALLLFVVSVVISHSIWAQKPTPSTEKTPPPTIDQFPEAHRGIFAPQADKAKDAVQLTDSVAKSLPAEPPFAGVMARRNFIDEQIFGRMERNGIPHGRLSGDEEF